MAGKAADSSPRSVPIWLAALLAGGCRALVNGQDHTVRWDCDSGRAIYTNSSTEAEWIEPLNVCVQGGHTVAVTWAPGETGYTVEVFHAFGCVA